MKQNREWFSSMLFYSMLFYSTLFYSTLSHPILFGYINSFSKHPQLPFQTLQVPAGRDHTSLNRPTVGGGSLPGPQKYVNNGPMHLKEPKGPLLQMLLGSRYFPNRAVALCCSSLARSVTCGSGPRQGSASQHYFWSPRVCKTMAL